METLSTNIDRMVLSIDDKDIQNRVKLLLIKAIMSGDIIECSVKNIIADTWSNNENSLDKTFTREQVLKIHIMQKG